MRESGAGGSSATVADYADYVRGWEHLCCALPWQSANDRVYAMEGCIDLQPPLVWYPLATNLSGLRGATRWSGQIDQATGLLRVKAHSAVTTKPF